MVASRETNPHAAAQGSDVPMLAADWSAESLAEVAIRFLTDPDLARRHTEAVRLASDKYNWDRTALSLVDLFRKVLSMPRRSLKLREA